MDTDMTADVTSPKSDPADIARLAVDGLEADLYEIVADDISHLIRDSLAGGVAALYPTLP
jgi:hypothetical protein